MDVGARKACVGGVKQYPWVVDLDVGMRRKLTFTDIGRLVNGLTKSLYQG